MCLSFENICLYSSLMVRCSTISVPFLIEFWLNFVFEKLYSVLLSWWTQENIMLVCQQHEHALFCTMGICDSMCFWNCIILLENSPNLMALQEWEGVVIIACLNNLSDCTLQCFCCWGSMILSSRNCSKAAARPAVWTGQMEMVISLIVFEICPDFEHVVLPWGSVGLFMGSYKLGQRVAVCWGIAVSFSVFPERNSLPPWASVRSPAWVFALCCGHQWFPRMFPLSLPSAALAIAAKLFLSFLPFWNDSQVPYPKQSVVMTCSEAALSGVKESHCPALLLYSPHALPRQQARILQ